MWKSNTLIFQKLHIYMHKKYQEKWENAYLRIKNARASRTLRWALETSQYWLTSLTRLHFASLAKSRENFRPPPRPDPGSTAVNTMLKNPLSRCCPCYVLKSPIDNCFHSRGVIFFRFYTMPFKYGLKEWNYPMANIAFSSMMPDQSEAFCK